MQRFGDVIRSSNKANRLPSIRLEAPEKHEKNQSYWFCSESCEIDTFFFLFL